MSELNAPKVAVVVPVYREVLSPDEEYAVRALRSHLSRYEVHQVSPRALRLRIDGLQLREYDERWFASVSAYSKLLLSRPFYEGFSEFDFILIYQLDCLVFRDELTWWCEQGYDYIGAPLPASQDDPAAGFSRVGNGGLSLRRVSAFLGVLSGGTGQSSTRRWPTRTLRARLPDLAHQPWPRRMLRTIRVLRDASAGVHAYATSYSCNEDLFWSDRARVFGPGFRIAPVEAGLRFAFDAWPRQAFALTDGHLPFGCHAWAKHDRGFWEPHLTRATHPDPLVSPEASGASR